jgi:hypothetical protein
MSIRLILFLSLACAATLPAADLADREALRFNDAVTKLAQTRDEALANLRLKAITALTVVAKTRTKANDADGAGEAWRAILSIDREHVEARAHFTTAGTLTQVLAELDAKPTDLLGLDTGEGSAPVGEKTP